MYTVYVLQDDNGKLYKGMTNNLVRRLKEHRSGHTITTSKMRNLKVIYTEIITEQEEAIKREKYLKSSIGRRFLRTKLNIGPLA